MRDPFGQRAFLVAGVQISGRSPSNRFFAGILRRCVLIILPASNSQMGVAQTKLKQEGVRRVWSMFPLTGVPFWNSGLLSHSQLVPRNSQSCD